MFALALAASRSLTLRSTDLRLNCLFFFDWSTRSTFVVNFNKKKKKKKNIETSHWDRVVWFSLSCSNLSLSFGCFSSSSSFLSYCERCSGGFTRSRIVMLRASRHQVERALSDFRCLLRIYL